MPQGNFSCKMEGLWPHSNYAVTVRAMYTNSVCLALAPHGPPLCPKAIVAFSVPLCPVRSRAKGLSCSERIGPVVYWRLRIPTAQCLCFDLSSWIGVFSGYDVSSLEPLYHDPSAEPPAASVLEDDILAEEGSSKTPKLSPLLWGEWAEKVTFTTLKQVTLSVVGIGSDHICVEWDTGYTPDETSQQNTAISKFQIQVLDKVCSSAMHHLLPGRGGAPKHRRGMGTQRDEKRAVFLSAGGFRMNTVVRVLWHVPTSEYPLPHSPFAVMMYVTRSCSRRSVEFETALLSGVVSLRAHASYST